MALNNTVSYLKGIKFLQLTMDEKLQIKGRVTVKKNFFFLNETKFHQDFKYVFIFLNFELFHG